MPVCAEGDDGQPPELVSFRTVQSDLNPLAPAKFRAADNFLSLSGGTIDTVTWWGFYRNISRGSCNTGTADCSGDFQQLGDSPDAFTITYYDDASIIPGNLFAGPFVQGIDLTLIEKLETGRLNILFQPQRVCAAEVQFRATHPPVAVAPETCYWIEIINRTSGECIWFWSLSGNFDNRGAHDQETFFSPDIEPGAPYDSGDRTTVDMAFCVDIDIGPTGCLVSEPAAGND